jgi:hypothetical protein
MFSVIIATYARDQLIVPTLDSVRQQSLTDFEVLVVSDGPPSRTLRKVVSDYDDRFSLLELPERSRSQSGPNNLGWSAARGEFIAYLGHDDVWHSDHLQNLADAYADRPQLDFVISGCLFLGPPGADDSFTWITGLFDDGDQDAPRTYLFPGSSISHRRDLPQGVGGWPEPLTSRRPVDAQFILNAAEQRRSFASTKQISVFKFMAVLRYLSYHCPEDVEQREVLQRMQDAPAFAAFIAESVAASIAHGGYMAPVTGGLSQSLPMDRIVKNEIVRGISLPDTQPLRGQVWIEVGSDNRGFDWHAPESHDGMTWRWTGPSHRPRVLLPFFDEGDVNVIVHVARFATEDIRRSLVIVVDGNEVDARTMQSEDRFIIHFVTRLRSDAPSVLEFRMNRTASASEIDPHTMDQRRLGLCLLGIILRPRAASVGSH